MGANIAASEKGIGLAPATAAAVAVAATVLCARSFLYFKSACWDASSAFLFHSGITSEDALISFSKPIACSF